MGQGEGPPTLPDGEPSPPVPSRTESGAPSAKRSESGSASDSSDSSSGLGSAALRWAEQGAYVLPLGHGGNLPHQMLGCGWSMRPGPTFIGSRDPEQIREWWREDPFANIGIITGLASGLLVVDLDLVEPWLNDYDSNAQLRQAGFGDLPRDVVVETARGLHLYVRLDVECPTRTGWLPKVDIKADGGYVVAPPSLRRVKHVQGFTHYDDPPSRSYEVEAPTFHRYRFLTQGTLPVVPDGLLTAVHQWSGRSGSDGDGDAFRDALPSLDQMLREGFGEYGGRNRRAYDLADDLFFRVGIDVDTVAGVLRRVWESTTQVPQHPFPWSEVERAMHSARRRQERKADERREQAAIAARLYEHWRSGK